MEFGMMSIRGSLFALLCSLAFMTDASPARSLVLTDAAPLSSPPVTVTNNNSVPLVFDFGQSFASVTSISFLLTFAGDLWDPNEMWTLNGVGGQINVSGVSRSSTILSVNPASTSIFADLLDGTFSTDITAQNRSTNSSFGLASVSLRIDATPLSVLEPASLALFAAGLVSIAGVRRRRV